MSEAKLAEEIVALSRSGNWSGARNEWVLEDVYISDTPGTCLCGHFPILEMCKIRNTYTHRSAIVGNYCVNKFIGLPSDAIFQAARRVKQEPSSSMNIETISHAISKGWINNWEFNFYRGILRKRKLTEKQLAKKIEISQKILHGLMRG